MDKYSCCGSDRVTDAQFCNACIKVAVDELIEQAEREALAHFLAVAALGPWGFVRYRFGSRMAASAMYFYGSERWRWWHGGQPLAHRGWMLLFQALGASERVSKLAERFGSPV
jgi:hypothetical protein